MSELGYAGFRTLTWNGLVAPVTTPKDIIDKLASEVALALKDEHVRQRLVSYGVDPLGDSPEQFGATIAADLALWAEAVKVAGVAAH
jgi:tripartite-type tricarboxylate transporter receptor subunit TctC